MAAATRAPRKTRARSSRGSFGSLAAGAGRGLASFAGSTVALIATRLIVPLVLVSALMAGAWWVARDYAGLTAQRAGLVTQQQQIDALADATTAIEEQRRADERRRVAAVDTAPTEWLDRPADPVLVGALVRLWGRPGSS